MDNYILNFPKGEAIFREGDKADKLYFILEGEIEIFIKIRKAQKLLAIMKKGEIFGEMAVVDAQPRSATVVAKTNTQCLGLTSAQLENIVIQKPPFALKLIRLLSHRLREANQHISELIIKDKEKQIMTFIYLYAKKHGEKSFKGMKIGVEDLIEVANSRLGHEKGEIRKTIHLLVEKNYLAYSVLGQEEVILMEKLEKQVQNEVTR